MFNVRYRGDFKIHAVHQITESGVFVRDVSQWLGLVPIRGMRGYSR